MSDTVLHKFESAKPDGLDATLVRPSNWNEEHTFSGGSDGDKLMRDSSQTDGAAWVSGETISLTNRVGEQLVAGDVVALDPDNDASVEYDDTEASTRAFVVAQRTINNLAAGPFLKSGIATVLVDGDVTRGHWLIKSATNAALEDSGVAQSDDPPEGSLAVALEAAVGPGTNLISVFLLGITVVGVRPTIQIFLASGTLTIPENVTDVAVLLVSGGGGGGGGGGTQAGVGETGGGGGGGASGRVRLGCVSVTPGDLVTVTVGDGGTAGTAGNTAGSNGGTGGTGGTTSFGSFSAAGGTGGTGGRSGANGSAGGAGGSNSGSTGGSAPGAGVAGAAGGDAGSASGGTGGNGAIGDNAGGGGGGASGPGGGGGNGGNANTDAGGSAGTAAAANTGAGGGGGGGGAIAGTNTPTNGGAGGAGGSGYCIVWW